MEDETGPTPASTVVRQHASSGGRVAIVGLEVGPVFATGIAACGRSSLSAPQPWLSLMVRSHGIKHNTLATIRQAGLLIRVNSRLAAPQSLWW
jgi:hypothetical protein